MGLRLKIEAIGIIILIALIGLVWFYIGENSKNKADKERMTQNLYNADFKIDSIKTKNGDYVAKITSLSLKVNEAKDYNSELLTKIDKLGLKIKDLESANLSEIEYNFHVDSTKPQQFFIDKKSDTTFTASFEDDYIKIKQKISLVNKFETIKIDTFDLNLKDSIVTAYKFKTKRYFIFWKKKTGIELYYKSYNPYFKLNKMQSIYFTK